MSIYKHLLETEKYINSISSVSIRDVEKLLSSIPEALKSNGDIAQKILETREHIKIITSEQAKLNELLSLCKRDLTYQNISSLREYLIEIYSRKYSALKDCINNTFKPLMKENESGKSNTSFREAYKTYLSNASYMTDFWIRTVNVLESDAAVLKSATGDSQKISLFHRSRLVRTIKINNRTINITILSKFSDSISMINKIKNQCDKLLVKPDIDENLEKDLLKIKSQNRGTIEEAILEIFFNTLVDVLSHYPDLLRDSVVDLHIDLLRIRSLGEHDSISDSRYIHLRFDVNEVESSALLCYMFGKKYLSPKDKLYITIVHELTHSSDYDLKKSRIYSKYDFSSDDYGYAKVLTGINEPPKTYVGLTAMITNCRVEGLARFSERIKPYLVSSNNIKIISMKSFIDYAYLSAAEKMVKYVEELNSPEGNLPAFELTKRDFFYSYAFGLYMYMIIYIADHEQNLRLAIHENNLIQRINSRFIRISYLIDSASRPNTSRLDNVIANIGDINSAEFQKYAKEHDWIVCDASEISKHLESMRVTEDVYMITSAIDLKNALTKFSMMNPIQFLDKYEWACEKLKIKNKIFERKLFRKLDVSNISNLRQAA